MNKPRRIVAGHIVLLATAVLLLFARRDVACAENVTSRHDKIPAQLQTPISVELDEVPFAQALTIIEGKGNLKLNYNRDRMPVDRKVTVKMQAVPVIKPLLKILNDTRTELVITAGEQLAIRPAANPHREIVGSVVDRQTGQPLAGVNVIVQGTRMGAATDPQGRFLITELPLGVYSVEASMMGYTIGRAEDILVANSDPVEVHFELMETIISLETIVVTPSRFEIMGKEPVVPQTLKEEDIKIMTFGEDIYRAITRLPGIAANDFSAKFTVRGGENEEILVLMDGLEIHEPFHQKDLAGGVLSIIDVQAIEGIDLLTGAFTAEYGDHMSGVFNIKSRRPDLDSRQASVGVSLMNARFMSEGNFHDRRGSWLVSARRGYFDLVRELMRLEELPSPKYYDVLGTADYQLSAKHTLSANVLHSGDQMDYTEDDKDENNTSYGNSYVWFTLKSYPSSRLFVQSLASYGKLTHDRQGLGYIWDQEHIDFLISDKRDVNILGFKQNWNLDISDRWYLKWGFDLKGLWADYDYLSSGYSGYVAMYDELSQTLWADTSQVVIDTTRTELSPSGAKLGAYLSNRFRIFSPITAEIGLRYDHSSYTDDGLFSPRVNLVYSLGKRTFFRLGWGYFHQTEGIHEINVIDGEDDFHPAELAKHWVAGLETYLRNGLHLRLEGYYKSFSELRPEYRNWSNRIEVYPEMQYCRFKVNLNGRISKGIEAYLKYDRGGKITCWASYALAFKEDDIGGITRVGKGYSHVNSFSGIYPGLYDQRHTVYLDVNYRPTRAWHFNLAWQYHTGWPYTERCIDSEVLSDGSNAYFWNIGPYHGTSYPDYHRMDVKVSRHFDTSKGRITAFVQIINLYDRKNMQNVVLDWIIPGPDSPPYLDRQNEYWFPLLPSFGISWTW
jgi:hypothetical protein